MKEFKEIKNFNNDMEALEYILRLMDEVYTEKETCLLFEDILHTDNFSSCAYYYNPYENVKIESFEDICKFHESICEKMPYYVICTLCDITRDCYDCLEYDFDKKQLEIIVEII